MTIFSYECMDPITGRWTRAGFESTRFDAALEEMTTFVRNCWTDDNRFVIVRICAK